MMQPYVSALVLVIIENIDDARIPIERHSDLTNEQKAAQARRQRAIRPVLCGGGGGTGLIL